MCSVVLTVLAASPDQDARDHKSQTGYDENEVAVHHQCVQAKRK
jgi:hypothetical protein